MRLNTLISVIACQGADPMHQTGLSEGFEIRKNIILAAVQGSRPKPYNIQIEVPEFSSTQKKQLLEIIQANDTILASLLNRQLPY